MVVERSARDVFVSSSRRPLSRSDGSALIFLTGHSQFKSRRNFDDEPRGPTAISPRQVGPPTRRELAPGRAPIVFDREVVLRAPAY